MAFERTAHVDDISARIHAQRRFGRFERKMRLLIAALRDAEHRACYRVGPEGRAALQPEVIGFLIDLLERHRNRWRPEH